MKSSILIIGASGYIGKNLKLHLESQGKTVYGTDYPNKENKDGLKYFSTTESNIKDLDINIDEIKYAVICSGISNVEECKKNQETAFKINVIGNTRVIEQCFENKIVPVFLSSDAVFSGEKGNYTESDNTDPVNVYGTHKKAIEDILLESKKEFLITRLSKVYGLKPNDGTFITSLISMLKQNKSQYNATDQIFCPIYIGDLVNLFRLAMDKNLRGLYNFCSPESFPRFQLGTRIKYKLNIKTGEVVPCSIKFINSADELPMNISMSNKKITDATGYKFSKLEDHILELEKNIENF